MGDHRGVWAVPLQVQEWTRGRRARRRLLAPEGGQHLYLPDGVGAHTDLLERLGPHTTGVGCVYIKDLSAVDLGVLEEIVARSYSALTADIYQKRAREGGQA